MEKTTHQDNKKEAATPEKTEYNNTITRGFFMSPDGENYTLFLKLLETGHKELYYEAPYYWGVVNLEKKEIFTYTEGDTLLIECKNQEGFNKELLSYYKFLKDQGTLKYNDEISGLLKELNIYPEEAA